MCPEFYSSSAQRWTFNAYSPILLARIYIYFANTTTGLTGKALILNRFFHNHHTQVHLYKELEIISSLDIDRNQNIITTSHTLNTLIFSLGLRYLAQ